MVADPLCALVSSVTQVPSAGCSTDTVFAVTVCSGVFFRNPESVARFRSVWMASMTSAGLARKVSPSCVVQSR